MTPDERLNRQAVTRGMLVLGVLLALWGTFGLGVTLGSRSVTSTVAGALAQNEATRQATMNRWMDSTCPGRLTNPLRLPIADTSKGGR